MGWLLWHMLTSGKSTPGQLFTVDQGASFLGVSAHVRVLFGTIRTSKIPKISHNGSVRSPTELFCYPCWLLLIDYYISIALVRSTLFVDSILRSSFRSVSNFTVLTSTYLTFSPRIDTSFPPSSSNDALSGSPRLLPCWRTFKVQIPLSFVYGQTRGNASSPRQTGQPQVCFATLTAYYACLFSSCLLPSTKSSCLLPSTEIDW